MKINVLAELRQPIGSTSSSELEGLRLKTEDLEVTELNGTVKTVRTDRGLLVTVIADALVQEQCSRCLQPVSTPLRINFTEEYFPTIDPNTGAPLHFPDAGDSFEISKDFFLDLTEGVRQYVLMSEPWKPLCSEDCRGFCPRCGADLNQHPCNCAEAGDHRWEPLAALSRSLKGDN
jgi:uncharacterized protein